MRTILIHCQAISGHQLEYLHHIYIGALNHPDDEFIFVVPQRFKKDSTLLNWPEARHIRIVLMEENELSTEGKGLLATSYIISKNLSKYVKQYNVTHVILISLIGYLPFLPLFIKRRVKVSGIIYRIFLYEWKEECYLKRLQDIAKYLIMSRFKVFDRVFLLNDKVSVRYLNNKYCTNKFSYLPDPVAIIQDSERRDLHNELGIKNGKKIILHPGSMNGYKGTLNILRAIDLTPQSSLDNMAIIFSGQTGHIKKQFDELKEKVQGRVQIIHKEGYLSFEELFDLFATSDYVLIPYSVKSQSSGIVGHAAYFKKPVVVGKAGLIGSIVRQNSLGFLLPDVTPESISTFLQQLPQWKYADNRYVEDHTINSFTKLLIENE